MNRLLGLAIIAGVSLGVNCGGDPPTVSGPGELKVRLVSPATFSDSAIVLTITGPAALTSATPGSGMRLFPQPLSATTRFALIGPLTNGATILTIEVPDIGAFSEYSGTIEGVAQADYQLRALNGYALAVTR